MQQKGKVIKCIKLINLDYIQLKIKRYKLIKHLDVQDLYIITF